MDTYKSIFKTYEQNFDVKKFCSIQIRSVFQTISPPVQLIFFLFLELNLQTLENYNKLFQKQNFK